MFNEEKFNKHLIAWKIRQKLNKTPTALIKILKDECERVLTKRSKAKK